MLALIGYDIRVALRNSSIAIWVVAFPILLATLLMLMLGSYETNRDLDPIAVGVVADANYEAESSAGLRSLLEGLAVDEGASGDAATGEDASDGTAATGISFALTSYDTAEEAEDALLAGTVEVVVSVDGAGAPQLTVPPNSMNDTNEGIVQAVLDRYVHAEEAVGQLAAHDPAALAGEGAVAALVRDLTGDDVRTASLDIMRVDPDMATRFYYAVLGFASIMGSNVASLMVERLRANLTPVGARNQVSSARPARQLGAALIASWTIVFCCLMVAFGYIKLVAGADFAGREVLVPVACAFCALVACAYGVFLAALPWPSPHMRDMVSTVSVLALSLPAGLYGDPAMALADWLTANLPVVQLINPAVQASNAFYTLAYYDSLLPFVSTLGALVAISTALFGVSAFCMRRSRYASL